jgi:cytochrome c-type biogenesis protein CcmE
MAFLPKSRTARKRLMIVGVAGGVLICAAVLVFLGLGNAVSFFYTPSQAAKAHPPAGRTIQLGGFVQPGSLVKSADGNVKFVVTDCTKVQELVSYKGELPDLFREGQGVVAKGSFNTEGRFTASEVLAKHDERYMPRELTKSLKASGEWRGDEAGGQTAQGGAPPPAMYQACAAAAGATKS